MVLSMSDRIQSFGEFYPYYLSEHRNGRCRQLHVFGSCLALSVLVVSTVSGVWGLVGLAFLSGYGPAWIGHFFFEKNKPATFQYPLWSFFADWVMLGDIVRGRIPITGELCAATIEALSARR